MVAEKIRSSVEKDLSTIENKKITISIGLTEVSENDTANVVYKMVGELLYKSKNSAKNKVSF